MLQQLACDFKELDPRLVVFPCSVTSSDSDT